MRGDGIDQELEGQPRAAAITGGEGHRRGQVAARAVPTHGKAGDIDAQRGRLARQPDQRRVGILEGSGILALGREPVVDARHRAAGGIGDGAADAVVGVEVADDPAPAVIEDEGGEWTRVARSVEPQADGPVRDRHVVFLHHLDLLDRAEGGGALPHVLACLLHRHALDGGQAEGEGGVHDLLHLGIERHRRLLGLGEPRVAGRRESRTA